MEKLKFIQCLFDLEKQVLILKNVQLELVRQFNNIKFPYENEVKANENKHNRMIEQAEMPLQDLANKKKDSQTQFETEKKQLGDGAIGKTLAFAVVVLFISFLYFAYTKKDGGIALRYALYSALGIGIGLSVIIILLKYLAICSGHKNRLLQADEQIASITPGIQAYVMQVINSKNQVKETLDHTFENDTFPIKENLSMIENDISELQDTIKKVRATEPMLPPEADFTMIAKLKDYMENSAIEDEGKLWRKACIFAEGYINTQKSSQRLDNVEEKWGEVKDEIRSDLNAAREEYLGEVNDRRNAFLEMKENMEERKQKLEMKYHRDSERAQWLALSLLENKD